MCFLALMLSSALFLAGCWDYLSLEERAFVLALGFDRGEQDALRVSAHVVLTRNLRGAAPGGAPAGQEKPYQTVVGEAATLTQALNEIRQDLPREIDYSHLLLLVVGEGLAREGVDFLQVALQSASVPNTVFASTARGKAEDVLRARSTHEEIPAVQLFLQMGMRHAVPPSNIAVELWQVMSRLADPDLGDPFMPAVTARAIGINTIGLAYYRGDRLAGYLDEDETAFLGLLLGRPFDQVIPALHEDKPVSLRVISTSRRLRVRAEERRLFLSVDLTLQGELLDRAPTQVLHTRAMESLENIISRTVADKVEKLLPVLAGSGSDVLGLQELLRRSSPHHPSLERWDQIYRDMTWNVAVRTHISARGYSK